MSHASDSKGCYIIHPPRPSWAEEHAAREEGRDKGKGGGGGGGGGAGGSRVLLDPVVPSAEGRSGASSEVGRCKLDPGLKAPGFQNLIVKKDNSAFNLKPGL